MALPMVHLLTAQLWVGQHPEYDCPEFYLGVISPDAIHIRDGNDKSRKNEFHLNNWTTPHPEEVIRYWKERSAPFDIGYGIHVLTDSQWVPRFRSRLRGLFYEDGRLNTIIYYNDTIQTDVGLYEAGEKGKALFAAIARAKVPADHPLLTEYELDQWRKKTAEMYFEDHSGREPIRFIDRSYVEEFIQDCQEYLNDTFRRYCDE